MTAPVTYADGRIVLDDGKVNAFSVPTLRALLAALRPVATPGRSSSQAVRGASRPAST